MASIYRRPNEPGGMWWFKDDTGYCYSLKTRVDSEAREYLDTQTHKKRTSSLGIVNRRALVADFIIEYDNDLRARRRKPKTILKAMQVLRAFQTARRPEKMIEVNDDVATAWYNARSAAVDKKEISAATMNGDIRTLRAAWTRAKALKMADHNPFNGLSFLKIPKKKKEIAADPGIRDRLLRAAEKWNLEYWLMAMTYRHSGIRLNELTHLRPQDISLKNNWIDINAHPCDCKVCAKSGGVWSPKNYEQRKIPLFPPLRKAFQRLPRKPGPVAFPALDDGVRSERSVENIFARMYRKAKIERAPGDLLHVLRHGFVSDVIKSGKADPYVLREWLGHSDIKTTMGYFHGDEKHSQEVMKRVARATIQLHQKRSDRRRN